MNFQSLVKTGDWQEVKAFIKAEIIDKPLEIKTEGLSAERIALEVLASQIATKKIMKVINKIERLGGKTITDNKSFI